MLGCLWLSAYGVGVLASRKSAVAGDRPRACLAMGGQERPDCRTRSDVRTLPREACKDLVVPVVRLAGEAGLVRVGTVAMEGTQRPGKAARPKARR
jgi:hypothetical protein